MSDRIKNPNELKKVDKPWGYEVWWAETNSYAGKFLQINPGCRMSLQFHKKKEETIYVMTGPLLIWVDPEQNDDPISLIPGSVYHVKPGQVHRFGAGKIPVMLCEVSSPYLDDVVRIHDDFKRK